ncbi:hypothetical protein IFM47457_10451 [Aspergillus lentulus]|nr:hypothetical protein IFM47457_10451 [Aspergillus lentulus]
MSHMPQLSKEPLTLGPILKSDSGRIYRIEEVLAQQRNPVLCRKKHDSGEFDYQLNLQKLLATCPNVRRVVEVKDLEMFIYPYWSGDLLPLSLRKLSGDTRRYILFSTIGIFSIAGHIKANNILVGYMESAEGGLVFKSVQISDLEDTVIGPKGKWLTGPLCGNAIWRSPESWCQSRQNLASDMIYVMVNEMVFRVKDDELNSADSWRHILRRHISYFTDEDGLNGFLEHIAEENPFYERLIDLANTLGPENPRQPFERWGYVEPDLRDLVGKMTNLDPTRRITGMEALQYRWLSKTG